MHPTLPQPLASFHPVIRRWFARRLGSPTAPQRDGWPLIERGENVLVAAPTGSGKTLAAFLACLDDLFRRALDGTLEEGTRVLYVSPLKALGNDVQKNLLDPLEEIYQLAREEGLDPRPIRVQVRSGDTPASERASMVRKPPHVLITTPESLFLYLTAARSRETLRSVRTVVVDEIHALARDKRGSHFALSMERLKALTGERLQCIGLSATQKPIELFARFLVGGRGESCSIVQAGHRRPWDLTIEAPDQELSAVTTHEMWGEVYDRLVELSETHRTILIFANTRKLSERIAHDLGERMGKELVAAHHGSMSRELRLAAERRLKSGELRVMVATASLELGIDIGSVDLVCQIGSPRSIATALQRVGRAAHHKDGVSKGIVFALTRDELVECTALLHAVYSGELDAVRPPEKPKDVLAQQIVAACSSDEWTEDALFELMRSAQPYWTLTRDEFDRVVTMLSEPITTSRGRSRVHLHRDRVNGRLRARRGAREAALSNAGAIPDTFTYPVIAEPEDKVVGALDEDFALESNAGDVFVLGSATWRVRRVGGGAVRVEDAHGEAPTVPFWLGEAPARTHELSLMVARLRTELLSRGDAREFLVSGLRLRPALADELLLYLRAGASALGAVPDEHNVVAERFFDEAGGMQLLIHAPFGGRINRAWGLALRKRFCRSFDFELQAAATDDGLLLSLGEQHSFPLAEIFDFLSPKNVEEVLTQAVLQTPLFPTRFRWNASRALLLLRNSMGRRVAPQIQRMRAEDLLGAVFPDQVACQDNRGGGDIEVPDHPLVQETVRDCLREAMDIDGLREVLQGMREGRIRTHAVDLPEPSPFAHALLNSAPYTYLDDAPLEERRARAVSLRRTLAPEDAAAFGALDAEAIARVVADAQPPLRDPDELHDALLQWVLMPLEEEANRHVAALLEARRCTFIRQSGLVFLVAAEKAAHARAIFPEAALEPLPAEVEVGEVSREDAIFAAVRGHMETRGPATSAELSELLTLPTEEIDQALFRLEGDGQVLRGRFRAGASTTEWCDRRLLQRIHRLTVGRLRAEIQPLSAQDFMRFLFRWHHVEKDEALRGRGGLLKAVELLEGWEAPAASWEAALLRSRLRGNPSELIERACWDGEVAWGRLTLKEPRPEPGSRRGAGAVRGRRAAVPGRNATLSFVRRESLGLLLQAARAEVDAEGVLADVSHPARDVVGALRDRGALFFADLVTLTRRLPAEVEDALWELLGRGLITADALENLRVLQSPLMKRRRKQIRRGGPGRWSLLTSHNALSQEELNEQLAMLFLRRYGIVWRDLVIREPLSPPWRELLWPLRRLEARGEIRGGRFVAGFAGEQYALPEAVETARAIRRKPGTGEVIRIAAVDPLNLTGIVSPGPRLASTPGRYVEYVDGVPRGEEATAQPLPIAV